MRRVVKGALVLLALFLLFEVGARHVPPDGMTVSYDDSVGDTSFVTQSYSAPMDQQTIADYYVAFNHALVRPAWILHGCAMMQYPSSVEFSWHGLPVESWTLVGCDYVESAGGVSDILAVQHLLPDISVPPPPPSAG
jgi:hypothetical protein